MREYLKSVEVKKETGPGRHDVSLLSPKKRLRTLSISYIIPSGIVVVVSMVLNLFMNLKIFNTPFAAVFTRKYTFIYAKSYINNVNNFFINSKIQFICVDRTFN